LLPVAGLADLFSGTNRRITKMAQSNWTIDASHSGIHFIARHMVFTKVRGSFKSFRGALQLDEADLTSSSVDVSIDVSSIDTGEPKRDGHLTSPDFFDAAQFPALTFKSTAISKSGDAYQLTGDLTIHGVTKSVTLEAHYEGKGKDPWGGERLAFTAKTSVLREDFGLTWNQVLEAGGLLVGSKIEIEVEVQAIRAQAA
jgi:polyisoprenoid-binding protein YceI